MLSNLKVTDLALVEGVQVDFQRGLNVLSGETGAGKTVLLGAISLLLGDRAEPAMVRSGCSEAVLEAVFDLEGEEEVRKELAELGYLDGEEDELILWRRIPREGKSRCTVNGRTCPVSALAQIGGLLVEIHGQNTHQALLRQATHAGYLDRFAGKDHQNLLASYRGAYAKMRSRRLELDRLDAATTGGIRELELLTHEVEELEAAQLATGELEELENRAGRLRHSSELWELGEAASALLSGRDPAAPSARELIAGASRDLARMAQHDPSLGELAERLASLGLETEDVAAEVDRYVGGLDTDPGELAQLESRLSGLREIARKYGGSVESAAEYLVDARERLAGLESRDDRRSALEEEIERLTEECMRGAGELSEKRRAAAGRLAAEVEAQMAGLGLEGALFAVEVAAEDGRDPETTTGALRADGFDRVEFLFSSERSTPLQPLRKIASGGEMSRVMLAVKIVLAEADRLPVLVYDEVDAGIGGETAGTVGEKLFELTRYHQVFCVTHLPQIASYADQQYAVVKDSTDGGSRTGIVLLDGGERVAEICRMLGDSSGRKATEQHARDILERAAERKRRTA